MTPEEIVERIAGSMLSSSVRWRAVAILGDPIPDPRPPAL